MTERIYARLFNGRPAEMVRNVLLITIDSLRKDHVSTQHDHTPCLSDLSQEGVSFDNAFATGPGTTPSFPALLTGTYGLSFGGLGPLSDERPRLSALFRRNGFATGGFQCNPFLSKHFNYDVGFDRFEDYQNPLMGFATRIFPRGIELNNPKLRRIDGIVNFTGAIKKMYQLVRGKPRPYVEARVITEDVIDWLGDVEPPFFCWTHFMDAHHPCYPPSEYRDRFGVKTLSQSEVSRRYSALTTDPTILDESERNEMRSLYRAAIAYIDTQVCRILESVRDIEAYGDTLVIVTSDHGELFGEHDSYGKPPRMFDELLRVPLIVLNGPEGLAESRHRLVSLIDVAPTVLHTLGLDVPDFYEGRLIHADPPRNHVLAEHEVDGKVIVGVRSKDWLFEADEIEGDYRLFKSTDGSLEKKRIDHPQGERLREIAHNRLESLDVEPTRPMEDMDGSIRGRLEDLGYL